MFSGLGSVSSAGERPVGCAVRVRQTRIVLATACALLTGACAKPPALPTGSELRVVVLDPAGTELRELTEDEVAWVQSALGACSWRRSWITGPVPEAALSFRVAGAEPVRVDFSAYRVSGTNAAGTGVSCDLGSTRGYHMSQLLAGTWQPPGHPRVPR